MRASLFALVFASMTMLAVAPASADATAGMMAMMQAFAGVHSYHADITTPKGQTLSMDVIQPDKVHMTMGGRMQMITIGGDTWMNMNGSWQHLPMANPMAQRPLDMAHHAGLSADGPSDYNITDLGPTMLGGVMTEKYHMVGKTGDTVDMWVAKNLPLQVQATGKDGTATIKYSEYNSVPDITPPM
jgi:hypothetical protein